MMLLSIPAIVAPLAWGAQQETPPVSDEAMGARLKKALEATGLKFATSASGKSYTIDFDHVKNRKQRIYLTIVPSRVKNMVTYHIYTTVWYDKEKAPDQALLTNVLSKVKKLGTFYLFKDAKNVWALRFGVHFDATDLKESPLAGDDLTKSLKDIIYLVDVVGEETDKELNGEKDVIS